jgi:hypothetical protein
MRHTHRLITEEPVFQESVELQPVSRSTEMRVSQFFCGLTGHQTVRRFDGGRMYLECTECGHESPGWSIR